MAVAEPTNHDLLNRFKGTLLGCAVGDALGAPFEGKPRSYFQAGTVMLDEYQRLPGYQPGQYTDETQLTIAVAESLINCGRLDSADVAKRFAQLFARGEVVAPGRVTSLAVGRIVSGTDWRSAAAEEGEAGNGPAARAAAVGLWHHDRLSRLREDAMQLCRLTHRDTRVQAGTVAMARAVAFCVEQKKVDTTGLLGVVGEAVTGINEEFSSLIEDLEGWVALPEDSALPLLFAAGAASPQEVDPAGGVPAFVVPTVLTVFYFFLRYHDDFELCLQETIRAGGDVDTTASMVASLYGASHGLDALPENLVSNLQNYKYLLEAAERLFRRKTSN
ncbi:MAG: ADP-ribosylglycohydrolase family protein [Candidatus Wallbacteria bacterium]|nr:ADP-ribosylglycohydrolase family protein [Candidatus Wallbacteria bacterium]